MSGNEAAQQLAVKTIDVAHQLLEVMGAAVNSEIDARMAELGVSVDEQNLLIAVPHKERGEMDGDGGCANAAFSPEEG